MRDTGHVSKWDSRTEWKGKTHRIHNSRGNVQLQAKPGGVKGSWLKPNNELAWYDKLGEWIPLGNGGSKKLTHSVRDY